MTAPGPRPCDLRDEDGIPCPHPAVFKVAIAIGGWDRDGRSRTESGELHIAVCERHKRMMDTGVDTGDYAQPVSGARGEPVAEGT